jgi:hypothetical protein
MFAVEQRAGDLHCHDAPSAAPSQRRPHLINFTNFF